MPHAVPVYKRPSNKDRLYIALYARGGDSIMSGGEDKYHWALLVGPKHEDSNSKGKRFHVKETMTTVDGRTQSRWLYEERDIGMNPTAMILVRVIIGKVANLERVASVLRKVPLHQEQAGWNCVSWLRDALEALRRDGKALSGARSSAATAGAATAVWEEDREAALDFVRRKERQHRFDGKATPGWFDMSQVATYDFLRDREVIA
ncbi:hypothetical protein KVR01_008120 [Diaporthe batatas]|uniref:uncharacterized protein n=1 Tax=Diaporthe batatas TaxID=748121 RepID=UPI001D04AA11|nr:uncharacterized protein KVR01_008120 [Diaporthe batatas]KAG8162355.1 hypothetical protein KVR01_008120 [Diaporthe batatas]